MVVSFFIILYTFLYKSCKHFDELHYIDHGPPITGKSIGQV